MNLDDLQSVQSRERQASDLQDLRPSFYADAAEFVEQLRENRQRVIREEGIDSPEFERLTNDIRAAERAVESIYERRVGKVVKRASIAAADMPTEDEGLTDEERQLFETLVADIQENRERVLSTLEADDGDDGAADEDTEAETEGETGTPAGASGSEPEVDASDLMGGGTSVGEGGTDPTATEPESDSDPEPPESVPGGGRTEAGTTEATGAETTGADVERATVRITQDVGEILGVDRRAYHLASEDVVTLPEANAEPLVERGAAERID